MAAEDEEALLGMFHNVMTTTRNHDMKRRPPATGFNKQAVPKAYCVSKLSIPLDLYSRPHVQSYGMWLAILVHLDVGRAPAAAGATYFVAFERFSLGAGLAKIAGWFFWKASRNSLK